MKTWSLLEIAKAVVTGVPAFGLFRVRGPQPILIALPENDEAEALRRLDAIVRATGDGTAADLNIAFLRCRSVNLTDERDRNDLRAAMRAYEPAGLLLDSVYRSIPGVPTNRLNEVAAAVTPVIDLCGESNAVLVASHHLNAQEGWGLGRLTGAGLAELATVVLLGKPGPRFVDEGRTVATVNWEVTARDVPDLAFAVTFTIGSDDPSDLSSPLTYGVEARISESPSGDSGGLGFLEGRVHDAVRMHGTTGATLHQINDVLAQDGRPLKFDTLRPILDALVDLGMVDGGDGRWWVLDSRGAQ
jgi:hypothetical protein